MKKRFALGDDVRGRVYQELLEFVASLSASFSLMTWKEGPSPLAGRALAELKSFEIEVHEVAEWPSGKLVDGTATLHRFKVSRESVSALLRIARGLFQWQNPDLPDDLCFYRSDGSVVLATTSGERYAELELTEAETERLGLSSIPHTRVRRN